MNQKTILTGITTTGRPHLGNYAGAIRPAIEASFEPGLKSFYFLADYHSLVKNKDPKEVQKSCMAVAATWLALGLDTNKTYFYRQSDIPEIPELMWILSTFTAKGLMNRAHAYKSVVQLNEESGGSDPDKGISMALFSYPILMAADILMFKATDVPVGQDQKQHMEMVRDVAQRFNHHYGDIFVVPQAIIAKESAILPGLDGRKMSKSYNNSIPLFLGSNELRKLIMKIKTNSLEPGEPKSTEACTVYDIYQAISKPQEALLFKEQLEQGMAWGDAKEELFVYIEDLFSGPKEEYLKLIDDQTYLESVLSAGAEKARDLSSPYLKKIKTVVGIGSLI